ncbi:MAG: rhamnogalacturonan acetylesterase [Acholeplasmatales bacterium]|nr:rhamnogalacturonan acetylesterase [Acholeplasmatales bacterium]
MKILMMGDSTMKKNNFYSYPQFGWGQGLELFVKDDIRVLNFAENGRSTKSFIDEGRFNKLLNNLECGDYVICSFGHNDEKQYDPLRYTTPFGTYQENLKFFKDEVEKKGGHIVFATSTTRHMFVNGVCVNSHGEYPLAMIEFAKDNDCTCIDLNKLTIDMYNEMGEEKSKRLHMIYPKNSFFNTKEAKDDHSHLQMEGAMMVAYQFVKAISETDDKIKECFIDINAQDMVDLKMLID